MKVTRTFNVWEKKEKTEEFDIGKILNEWDLSKNRMDRAREALEKITEYPGVVWDILEWEKLIETEKQEVAHGSKDHFVFITEKGKEVMDKSRLATK